MRATQATVSALAQREISKRLKELVEKHATLKHCSRKQAIDTLIELRDQESTEFFSVLFIRRHAKDGFPPERLMRCSFNVTKYEVGGPPKYDPKDYNLFWVFDIEAMAYRSINAETILEVTLRGERFKVTREYYE